MKADHFSRYSEPAWLAISAEAERVCDRPPMSLRSELERLGRECIAASSRTEPTPGERWKFLEAKQRQVAEFRRLLVEEGELPRPLQERAAEVVSEMERLYLDRCEGLAGRAISSSRNARKAHVDEYFESLIDTLDGNRRRVAVALQHQGASVVYPSLRHAGDRTRGDHHLCHRRAATAA